jgi:ferric-dicitrate binding protein FerR (iron transport regulator)
LVALVVVVLFALQEALFWPPPLSLTIGSPMEGGVPRDWASAPDDARLPIRFSDGTLIDLEPKARARVVAVSRAGAEIVIESGRAHFAVTPVHSSVPGDSPWRVSLGPFSVEVKCTRFDVEWDPRTDALALDVFEGSVRVSGCQDRHSHTLVAGHGVRGVVQQDGVDAGVCAPCKGSTSAETAARHIDDVALTA